MAALEALLALRHLARERVSVELVAPEPDFAYRPLSVAEPFGLAEPRRLGLAEIARGHGAAYRRDSIAGVNPGRSLIVTEAGERLPYGALVLAVGARRSPALPGALTFRGVEDVEAFRGLLTALERGEAHRVVFAVPPRAQWPLPLYELALLAAAHLASRGVDGAELEVITHERRPLGLFGRRASDRVSALLDEAGVRVSVATAPERVQEGSLITEHGRAIRANRVVALPRLDVPDIPGVPQGRRGFILTDSESRVEGLDRVFAAGRCHLVSDQAGGPRRPAGRRRCGSDRELGGR